jgi:hypothetical protein
LFADYAVYHSLYDDFTWMEKYGDPMFRRHVAGIPYLLPTWCYHVLKLVPVLRPMNVTRLGAWLHGARVCWPWCRDERDIRERLGLGLLVYYSYCLIDNEYMVSLL